MIPLITYILSDVSWICVLYENSFSKFILRLAWFSQPLEYYSLSLFLHSMINPSYTLSKNKKIILYGCTIFFIVNVSMLTLLGYLNTRESVSPLVSFITLFLKQNMLLINFSIKIMSIAVLVKNMIQVKNNISDNHQISYILKRQILYFFMLLSVYIIPEIAFRLSNLFLVYDCLLFAIPAAGLCTFSLMFCARRIYQLRFLNLMPLVQIQKRIDNSLELAKAKQALCEINNFIEIPIVTAQFFENNYAIARERVVFISRLLGHENVVDPALVQTIEQFIHDEEAVVAEFFKEDAVLAYEELAFTHFYEHSTGISKLLTFLRALNTALFMPLKQGSRLLGFIIILKNQTKKELFSQSVQTQMGLFCTYVTYTMTRLEQYQYQNVLIDKEHLTVEVQKIYQKIAKYQESFMQLLKNDGVKKQGIILFKNTVFTFINNAAEELLQINPNAHQGHPLTKALKEIVRRVSVYGNSYALVEKNILGEDICCYGFPYKKEEVIILVTFADVMQTLKFENSLKPSDLDYFIFLHTTQAGALVQQKIPTDAPHLQQFKIQFLKVVLSKKSILLDVHEDDIQSFVGLICAITLKKLLHTIDLSCQPNSDMICMSLFGVQRFDNTEKNIEHGLLWRMDQQGILFIKNIHFLDVKTQDLLAQFIKTGSFNLYKSEQRIFSNVMIVCTSTEDLKDLTQKGLFSKQLFEQLEDSSIIFPSLVSLPFEQLESLAKGLQKQAITVAEYHHLFGFSSQERENLDQNRPCSLSDLEQRISSFIKQRMKHMPIAEETSLYGPEKNFADPVLVEAVRLGKQALKDRKIMRALWDKLKSQSKIAQLLSVDRSSVHRRCKEFGFFENSTGPDIN
jgi:transcriptional regulator with PAS, ATPase and Fis domain